MDTKETILRKIENIRLNNTILQLEDSLKMHEKNRKEVYIKSKQMLADLIEKNTNILEENENLKQEKEALEQTIHYYQQAINKLPKFILKIFLRHSKNTLLDKGNEV